MDVRCPTCRKITEYAASNPHRPFCSERCQTLDLGAWADEQYRVPVEDTTSPEARADADDDAPARESTPPKHRLN